MGLVKHAAYAVPNPRSSNRGAPSSYSHADKVGIALPPSDGGKGFELLGTPTSRLPAPRPIAVSACAYSSTTQALQRRHMVETGAEACARPRGVRGRLSPLARRSAWRRWLPAKHLEFEITEGLLIDDTEDVFGKLNWLLSLVSGSSWDDFGTSYSSFSYFARFVFHKIKIDRQLVRNMTRDPAMRVIVNTIIALGKFLDVIVTGKGGSSHAVGCPQVQGFLYGQPGSPDAASKRRAKVTPIKPTSSPA
jgi:predicted signal transduction protein with EAL and GGDEF domain